MESVALTCRTRLLAATLLIAGCGLGNTDSPTPPILEEGQLTIAPAALDQKEAANLSGAACASDGTCLLIGDEMRHGRLFKLKAGVLEPGLPVYILPALDEAGKKMKESDGEGVAFADGWFYVIGSHSNSKSAKVQPSRHHVWRLPAAGLAAAPGERLDSEQLAVGLQSVSLDYLINSDARLQPYLAQAAGELAPGEDEQFNEDQHGPNIEGVAVAGGQLFVGFRGPVGELGAILWSIPLEPLFRGEHPQAQSFELPLGEADQGIAVGIRDVAAVNGGLLILSGPEMRSRTAPQASGVLGCVRACPKASLFYWPEGSQTVRPLGEIDLTLYGGDSPEAITVIEETDSYYRIMLLSDGETKTNPRILRVHKT